MAGKRQHYLPQFLQRGFVSTIDGRQTWLYLKNAPPREVGIRDVGVEENFYNVESDSSVDKTITIIEREEFAGIIEQARIGSCDAQTLSHVIPTLIAHLEVRSRHLRMTFTELANRAWTNILGYFDDPALAAAMVREHLRRNPAELRKLAAKELRSKGLPSHMAPTFAKQTAGVIAALPDHLLIASFWTPLLPHIRAALESRMGPSIKKAHIDALARSVSPETRVDQYRRLHFSIRDIASNDLILGDAAVLFQVKEPDRWKPYLDKGDELIAVYLPITPARVIVGSLEEPAIESPAIRQQVARTSHNFFISAQSSPSDIELSKQIGVAALPLSEDEMRSLSQQVLEGQLPPANGKAE
jgi:hypothetical protein